MIDNTALMQELWRTGKLRIAGLPELPIPPAAHPPTSRVRGALLGLAIGDSLGNTTESQRPAHRAAAYGKIRDYLPNHHAGGKSVGLPSDDTQLAVWLLDSMLDKGGFDPEDVVKRFSGQQIFGIGRTMKDFLGAQKSGLPLWDCGQPSAGNGALMRVAVVPLFHAGAPSEGLWADALLSSALTHNDPTSTASCVAFAAMIWDLLQMPGPPEPEWWARRFVEVARPLEGPTHLKSRVPGSAFDSSLCDFIEGEVLSMWRERVPVGDALNRWYSGAYLLETVPSALYVLMAHGGDSEEAIVRSVNDTWDNDTVGAIVGAAVGALHGEDALPERWRNALLGRTTADDDGHLFQTLERLGRHLGGRL
jgi:ADP-ribosylglycohydrolase